MRTVSLCTALIAVAIIAAACSGTDEMTAPAGMATLQVKLTDAPSDYIEVAEVTISSVHLIPGDENGRVELLEEGPATFDLMQLRDGIEAFLAEHPIPEGTYNQLRLIVADASVTLIEGVTFDDGSSTRALVIPSGMQTGIKVKTDQPIVAEEGELIVTVVDFDVDQSFEIQGDPEVPNGVRDVRFRPVLNEKRRSETAM